MVTSTSSGYLHKDDCRPRKIEIHAGWSEAHKHGDLAHSRPTLCDETSRIFLTATPSYDAVACHLAHARSICTTENSRPVSGKNVATCTAHLSGVCSPGTPPSRGGTSPARS
jgi:hypothetical protein